MEKSVDDFEKRVSKALDGAKVYVTMQILTLGKEHYPELNEDELALRFGAAANEMFFDKQEGEAKQFVEENKETFFLQAQKLSELSHIRGIISHSLMMKAYLESDQETKERYTKKALELNPDQKHLSKSDIEELLIYLKI